MIVSLKNLRTKKGYSQEALARALNISLRYYQNIEAGKQLPNVIIGLDIAKLLNIDPYLLWHK